jgi:hypothetical protein
MPDFDINQDPQAWGTWDDAAALRRWSFERRTPEQRLAWLRSALELAYQSGALQPRRPEAVPDPGRRPRK